MAHLRDSLPKEYGQFKFVVGDTASWSPNSQQITYVSSDNVLDSWSLLHELGHALLEHKTYYNDVNLLQKEAEAWEKAIEIGAKYNVTIAQSHIQHCLDSYREWLYQRSECPQCQSHGIQDSENQYKCLNCTKSWRVGLSRFCRPYRQSIGVGAK